MDRYNWDNVPEEKLNDRLSRWAIHTPQFTVAKLLLKKGVVVPLHSHLNAQLTWVQQGSLLFRFPHEEIVVQSGDVLPIPPDLPHSAEALEDTIALDTFTPPRQDWIRGDDSYLRSEFPNKPGK